MFQERSTELEQDRINLQELQDRSQTFNVSMGNLAGMGAYFMDPELLATIPFSGGASVSGRVAANAWRSFKIESGLAFVSETAIAPKVYEFKHKIGEEEYSLQDAAFRIVTATLGAGLIRAGGSATIDLSKIALAKAKLLKAGKVAEANTLDDYVKMVKDAPLVKDEVGNIHIMAQAKTKEAFEKGEILSQKDLDDMLGDISSQKIDPNEIQVDAKTFQYKTATDDLGVSDALKGVKKWEPIKADSILVWERLDGARFVADGHQRLALAKRMIAGGEDAQDIGLSAFILREADGFGVEFTREYAALRNIASGSGTALDAAKVFRSGSRELDNLPPNSALVRDARGLSRLDDEAFRLVVDEIVSQKYGAIVGDIISEAAEQTAVIRALAKAKPANATQARFMVQDMKAAGFTKTKTQDLFGGQEITESLFKERAKVIDSAIKKIKKDKSVFKTLAEQESRISGVGNKLDREANLSRLSDDEKTLAALTSLANAKGRVSDAINVAAQRVKDGESIQRATRDILPELRRSGESELNARSADDGARDADTALKPEKGKPVQLQHLDSQTRKGVELDFKSKQKGHTVKQYYEAAKGPQKEIVKLGKELDKLMGDSISFISPGVKKLNAMRSKIKRKSYEDASHFTDVCRCGFAVKDASHIDDIITRISKDYEILDEGIFVHQNGYFDNKILVRFNNGIVGEVQIWEPHLLAAKEGAAFVEDSFPAHLKEYISKMDIPSSDNSGHALYSKKSALVHKGDIKKGKEAEYKAIDEQMQSLYANSRKSANVSWKSALESSRPESRISTGEAFFQSSPAAEITQPSIKLSSDGDNITAGRPSQSKNAETSLKSKPVIDKTSRNIVPQDKNHIPANDPYLDEMKLQEARMLLDQLGDDFQVVSGIKSTGRGDVELEFKSARAVLEEMDNEQKVVDDLFECVGGGRG